MKTKKYKIFLMLLMLCSISVSTACGNRIIVSKNSLGETIGGETYRSILDGGALKEDSIDNPYRKTVEKILRGDKAYQKEHREMKEKILEYVKDSSSGFPENKEVYLSLSPIFKWDAMEEWVSHFSPCAFFFTKDMEAVGVCSFDSGNGTDFKVAGIDSLDESVRRAMQENSAVRLLFVDNGSVELVLKEDNTILYREPSEEAGVVTVEGEYFQKVEQMDAEGISFSGKMISADTILLK